MMPEHPTDDGPATRDAHWIAVLDSLPFSLLPDGVLDSFGIDGVVGFYTGQPMPEANVVGQARLGRGSVDTTITQVADRFGSVPYLWTVGPLSTPDNLPARLQHHGLREGAALIGLVFDGKDVMAPDHPWHVARVTLDEALRHAEPLALAYGMGMTAESFGYVLRAVGASSAGAAVYLAEDRVTSAVVGYGVSVPLGPRVVLLSGSATVPSFRGRGVYRALVGARLRDAWAAGVEAALITAVADTSAPICTRLGFRACCTIQQWYGNLPVHPPQGSRAGAE